MHAKFITSSETRPNKNYFYPVLKDLQNYKKIYINNKTFKGLNKLRFKFFLEDLTCQNSDYLSISYLLTGLTCFNDIHVFVISKCYGLFDEILSKRLCIACMGLVTAYVSLHVGLLIAVNDFEGMQSINVNLI